jgi:hypothetical protein
MVKSCSNCGKSHRNRITDLCNDCRPVKEFKMCKCEKHHLYGNFTVCKKCYSTQLKDQFKTYLFN